MSKVLIKTKRIPESNSVMYIFINKSLHMSAGKLGAQAAHAAIEAYKISKEGLVDEWYLGRHYTKLVMQASDEQNILTIQRYLKEREFESKIIVDEGMTEIDPHQITALGVEVVDRNDPYTWATFGTFKLYQDNIKVTLEYEK